MGWGGHKKSQHLYLNPRSPSSFLWNLWTLLTTLKCTFKHNFNRSGTERLNLMHPWASLRKPQLDTAEFIQSCTGRPCSNPEDTLATLPTGYPTPLRSRTLGQQRLSVMKQCNPSFEERIAFDLHQSTSRA